MPKEFSKMDIKNVKQLSQFKIDYGKIRNLEYTDKNNIAPQSFSQFRAFAAPAAMQTAEQPRPTFPTDLRYLQSYSTLHFPKGKMLVLVNSSVYPSIASSVSQYVMDVAYEGYFAMVFTVTGGTPEEMRSFIRSKMPVVGALMIGSLPVAWFEMANDFHGAAEFPCDLFFMDLNGTWNDPDKDGKYSEHPASVEPEIWISRLWTPSSSGNDAALLNNYFARNHRFRKGQFGYCNNALAYVDDDWTGFGDCALDLMLPAANVEVITDPATTDADRYKAEINQHRAWAQVCAHSSPGGHSFKIPGGTEWVPNTYLRDVNAPNAYFYNLFACSNALFTQPDYMAGWYIFDKPGASVCNGLAAVGSTKSGSMQYFENFYGPMGSGSTIGEAYLRWWMALGNSHDLVERQWYYGMVLLGDPTLNWWSGAVPTLCDPLNGDTFDHFPRRTSFHWNPINLKGVAVTYNIEIDAFSAISPGKWAAEAGKTMFVSGALSDNNYEQLFVGKQMGRWRVRANAGGRVCPWSDWSYFNYTI